jgi:hypothetical protein
VKEISGVRSLHRLIYASRVAIPGAELDAEVDAIIRASVENNRRVGVTGLLLVHGGWFLQALEGPAQEVMTTYGRITRDPRHADAAVLAAGPAERREFSDWHMCARRITPGDDAILETLTQRGLYEPMRLTGAAALRLLNAVRGIQRRLEA